MIVLPVCSDRTVAGRPSDSHFIFSRRVATFPGFLALALLLMTGCRREEISVYTVPKEVAQGARTSEGGPQAIHWKTPAGWEETGATGVRVGSFKIRNPDGNEAEVTVIPFPGTVGTEIANVNRWRGEIGLEPVSEDQMKPESVSIGSDQAKLFDFTGATAAPGRKSPARTVAAILQGKDQTWFFKMKGDEPAVAGARPAFLQFLASVSFADPGPAPAAAASAPVSTNVKKMPGAASDQPSWDLPAAWQEQVPPPMVLHSFAAGESEKGRATVTVSALSGDGGGLLLNVNRWRGQLGLGAVEERDLKGITRTIDVLGGKAMLVDMTGTDARSGRPAHMLAVIVPREGRTWFYKMMGEEGAVASQKETFLKFVQTVRYPDA